MGQASVKETAAALRKRLHTEFPGTRFSVRMSTGTAYGWLHVRYTDGPAEDAVRRIAAEYESLRFDGMDDGYHATGVTKWTCRGVNTTRETTEPAEVETVTEDLPAETIAPPAGPAIRFRKECPQCHCDQWPKVDLFFGSDYGAYVICYPCGSKTFPALLATD